MRLLACFISLMLIATNSLAQDAKVTLKASKNEVVVGEQFNIVITSDVNGNGDIELPKEMQIVSRMSGSSSRFINGQQSFEVTRTFGIIASAKGQFTIPAVTWNYGNGKTIKSNSLKIKVIEGTIPQQQPQQQYYDPFSSIFGPPRQQQQQPPSSEKHFGMLITSKKEVYVGEPIIISGKVYFDGHIVDIADFESYKMNLMGHKTDLRSDKTNLSVSREEYGGKMYQTVPLFDELIIPQQSGEYTFSPFSIKVGFQRGFFDQGYKLVKSNETTINVLPLPKGAPAGFDGAVGNYKVGVSYDTKPKMQAGDIFGITLKVEGTGNINLLNTLSLNLPDGIVLYGDPKIENKTKVTRKGAQGTIEYDFIAQIEKGGKYKFKPFEFCYFNPETKRYEVIDIPEIQFEATGEVLSEKEIVEIAQAEEEEKIASQVWKTITIGLIGFLLLLGLLYFLKKNSEILKFKPKKRKVDAHAVALKSLDMLMINDSHLIGQIEKIIVQFFKDFTQNEHLLISESWLETDLEEFGVSSQMRQQWRVHFSNIQALKYANFGQMSQSEMIDKTRNLISSTRKVS